MNTPIALSLVTWLSIVPLITCRAQEVVVRPAPVPGCTGPGSADSTAYAPDEVSPGPQLRSAPGPHYPPALRRSRISGYATLTYVINVDGMPDTSSIRVKVATDSAFIAPSRATVLGARFWPACRGGVPVRAQVTQTIRFDIKD